MKKGTCVHIGETSSHAGFKEIFFFCNLVVNTWNSLPGSVVEAGMVNSFKERLYA